MKTRWLRIAEKIVCAQILPLLLLVAVTTRAQTPDLNDLEKRLHAAEQAEAAKQADAAKKARAAKAGDAKKGEDAKAEVATTSTQAVGGRVFRDHLNAGGEGPEMVVIPAGKFMMGSPSYEGDRDKDEDPQHEVTMKRFALGKYPVTKAQFAAFVGATSYHTDAEKNTQVNNAAAAGCFANLGGKNIGWKQGTSWRDPGFPQDDNHPATCLSWNDAIAYAQWLRASTGKAYRLPSEAESEYTTRAGSTERYPWGGDADQACQYANVADAKLKQQIPDWAYPTVNCDDGYAFTSPVGHYKANAFGLYGTIGNVWKWTQDCGADSYANAPTDGRANESAGCDKRVLRGASWAVPPAGLRSAFRFRNIPVSRLYATGLRVAQDL